MDCVSAPHTLDRLKIISIYKISDDAKKKIISIEKSCVNKMVFWDGHICFNDCFKHVLLN